MAITSTKSRGRKRQGAQTKQRADAQQQHVAPPPPEPPRIASEFSPLVWRAASFAVLLVATLLRVYKLELNPLHHDEGVNSFFLLNLIHTGVYHYDPANYHGPTLYYFALPLIYPLEHFQRLDTWALRALTVAFGIAVVWLALRLRQYIGAFGALSAAALLAVSPGMVYNSRYFIHEMLFLYFTLGIVVAALRFYEGAAQPRTILRPRLDSPMTGIVSSVASLALSALTYALASAGNGSSSFLTMLVLSFVALAVMGAALYAYDGPRATYLLLASVSAALLFATKETAFITASVLALAALLAWVYIALCRQMRRAQPSGKQRRRQARAAGKADESDWRLFIARSGGWRHLALLAVVAVGVFLFINLVYYSSFFTNPQGVYDGFYETFRRWTATGTSDFHRHPFETYIKWLLQEEAPLLILGALGACLAVIRGRSRFALFAGAWAFGILLAYSLVPYKTPWLQLNFLLPLAIIGGYALDVFFRRGALGRAVAVALLVCALGVGLYQTYQLNFVHYDDDRYVYVYAHTQRGYLDLLNKIDEIARRDKGYDTDINIASPDYWPMPWYLRDYKHVGYVQHLGPTNDAIVIINANQAGQALAQFGAQYREVGTYPLRPGVTLELFVRRDIAD